MKIGTETKKNIWTTVITVGMVSFFLLLTVGLHYLSPLGLGWLVGFTVILGVWFVVRTLIEDLS